MTSIFNLPSTLTRLIAEGGWPSTAGPSMVSQQLHPTIPADRVRLFADDESVICLQPPPFPTVAKLQAAGPRDFWEKFGALDHIKPELVLVIGDFGLGSDSVIVLDYSRNAANPPVFRLRWGPGGVGNTWVQGARDFDEFATMLGLGPTH